MLLDMPVFMKLFFTISAGMSSQASYTHVVTMDKPGFFRSLIGGGQLFNTLLEVMLSTAVLTNEVCIAWSDSFLGLATNGTQFGCF